MAVVKITDAVASSIRGEVRRQFNTRYDVLRERERLTESETVEFVSELINIECDKFGYSRDDFDRIPKGFMSVTDKCNVRRVNGFDIAAHLYTGGLPQFQMPLTISGYFPEVKYSEPRPVMDAFIARFNATKDKLDAITTECDTMLSSVDKILASFPTLNRAIEYWPQLTNLIPQDIKDRLARKVERTKNPALPSALENLELDSLAVSLVKNKLADA